jgi:hypothetical protein
MLRLVRKSGFMHDSAGLPDMDTLMSRGGTMTKKEWERKVFESFVRASGLNVCAESISLPDPPLPDIRCTIEGREYFFELGEVVPNEQAEALSTKGIYRSGIPDPNERGPKALLRILAKKQEKQYQTHGSPVDLIVYFNKDFPFFIADVVSEDNQQPTRIGQAFAKCGEDGPFERIWIYDSWADKILPIPQ